MNNIRIDDMTLRARGILLVCGIVGGLLLARLTACLLVNLGHVAIMSTLQAFMFGGAFLVGVFSGIFLGKELVLRFLPVAWFISLPERYRGLEYCRLCREYTPVGSAHEAHEALHIIRKQKEKEERKEKRREFYAFLFMLSLVVGFVWVFLFVIPKGIYGIIEEASGSSLWSVVGTTIYLILLVALLSGPEVLDWIRGLKKKK